MKYYHQRLPTHLGIAVLLSVGEAFALRYSWLAFKVGYVALYSGCFALTASGIILGSAKLTALYEQKRHLRGARLLSNKAFVQEIDGDGIAIPNNASGKKPAFLTIKQEDETKHILICGDTGSGKSTILHYFAMQVRHEFEHYAVFYDPKLEYWKYHGSPGKGDILLYPFSEYCPYWDLANEVSNPGMAKLIAESLLPCTPGEEEQFFVRSPRNILKRLLLEMKQRDATIEELLSWIRNEDELDAILAGHNVASLIPRSAANQRAGVIGSLNAIADHLELLPPCDGREVFSLAEWVKQRPGSLFIGAVGVADQQALQPLFSIWFNILIQQLLNLSPESGKPPATWIFIDELASLKNLSFLEQAASQARSYNTRLVLGFQNRYQIENFYHKLAMPILSAPKTKIFLRTSEIDSAEWCARMIGEPEFERRVMNESSQVGMGRHGESIGYRDERKTEYLILPSEFLALSDRQGFLQYQGITTPIEFEYPSMREAKKGKRHPLAYRKHRRLKRV
ncbi:MAG: type IV secretion system DNA-binding domain-containing protein [Cyanothece sp. SIO1E1]|nr:type IV secretion system DNA-binding domain-containing protein [Cyanothece sp. SIO1E1]